MLRAIAKRTLFLQAIVLLVSACSEISSPCEKAMNLKICEAAKSEASVRLIVTYAEEEPDEALNPEGERNRRTLEHFQKSIERDSAIVVEQIYTNVPQVVVIVEAAAIERFLALDSYVSVRVDDVLSIKFNSLRPTGN